MFVVRFLISQTFPLYFKQGGQSAPLCHIYFFTESYYKKAERHRRGEEAQTYVFFPHGAQIIPMIWPNGLCWWQMFGQYLCISIMNSHSWTKRCIRPLCTEIIISCIYDVLFLSYSFFCPQDSSTSTWRGRLCPNCWPTCWWTGCSHRRWPPGRRFVKPKLVWVYKVRTEAADILCQYSVSLNWNTLIPQNLK